MGKKKTREQGNYVNDIKVEVINGKKYNMYPLTYGLPKYTKYKGKIYRSTFEMFWDRFVKGDSKKWDKYYHKKVGGYEVIFVGDLSGTRKEEKENNESVKKFLTGDTDFV